MKFRRRGVRGGILLTFIIAVGLWHPAAGATNIAQTGQGPQFKVDPNWPKPLPAPKDATGVQHQWVVGQVGGDCVDSHDHIFALNRAFQDGQRGMFAHWGNTSIPAPPVIEYDSVGNIVHTWATPRLRLKKISKAMDDCGYARELARLLRGLSGSRVDWRLRRWRCSGIHA